MTTVSYTDFRKNLAKFLQMLEEDAMEIVITRGKGRKAVALSLDEYTSLLETAYLLSSPKNRKHLEKSMKEMQDGKAIPVEF